MGNPILVVVAEEASWRFDVASVTAGLSQVLQVDVTAGASPIRVRGGGGDGEVNIHPASVAVRADRETTSVVIARLRELAPRDVRLVCFDEAFIGPEVELGVGVTAAEIADLLYS